jgi:hypothetical protein
LAVSLAYPSGEKGGKFLVQMISTWLRNTTGKGGGGGQHPVVMIYFRSNIENYPFKNNFYQWQQL